MNWRKFVINTLTLFIGVVPISAFAQLVKTTDVLSMPITEQSLSELKNNIEYLRRERPDMSSIEKLEFRTETDEWEPGFQEYVLRAGFNSRKLRSVDHSIALKEAQLFELNKVERAQAVTYQRYLYLLDWYMLKQFSLLRTEEIAVLSDLQLYHNRMLNNAKKTSIDALLNISEELNELQVDSLESEWNLRWILQNLALPSSTDLSLDQWVTPSQIEEGLIRRQGLNLSSHTEYTKLQLEKEREELRLKEEEAKGNQVLDFLQLKYKGDDKLMAQREFSLGLSLNIPMRNHKLEEHKVDIFEEEYKLNRKEEELKMEVEEAKYELRQQLDRYELLLRQQQKTGYSALLQSLGQNPNINPASLLNIKRMIIGQEKELLETYVDVLEKYLELLVRQGNIVVLDALSVDYLTGSEYQFTDQ